MIFSSIPEHKDRFQHCFPNLPEFRRRGQNKQIICISCGKSFDQIVHFALRAIALKFKRSSFSASDVFLACQRFSNFHPFVDEQVKHFHKLFLDAGASNLKTNDSVECHMVS